MVMLADTISLLRSNAPIGIFRRLLYRICYSRRRKREIARHRRQEIYYEKVDAFMSWLLHIVTPFIVIYLFYPNISLLHVTISLMAIVSYAGLVFVSCICCEDYEGLPKRHAALSRREKRLLREQICITIVGAGPHKTFLHLRPSQTFEDVEAELRKRRLIPDFRRCKRLRFSFVYTGSKKTTISASDTLEGVGIEDLSVVHFRYHVLGGSTKRPAPPFSDEENTHDEAPGRTRFPSKRPDVWAALPDGGYRCCVCHTEPTFMTKGTIKQHERGARHRTSLQKHDDAIAAGTAARDAPCSSKVHESSQDDPGGASAHSSRSHIPDRLGAAIQRMLSGERASDTPQPGGSFSDQATMNIDWDAPEMHATQSTADPRHDPEHALRILESQFQNYLTRTSEVFDVESDESDCEAEDWPDSESEYGDATQDSTTSAAFDETTSQTPDGNVWYPWPNRETCILDILRHLPRCSFSRKQNSAIHWALRAMGMENIPSDRLMDELDSRLQRMCGIETLRCEGKLGHVFYMNDLAGIIAQEMANKSVRDKLHFYPEETKPRLAEAWQADRWLKELDSSLATPMVRAKGQDFYVHEPTLMRDGSVYMPIRWFKRGSEMWAQAWEMKPGQVDQDAGWVILKDNVRAIKLDDALLSLPHLATSYEFHGLPDPRRIHGFVNRLGQLVEERWSLTDPKLGNPWRAKSCGHRVLSFMMWLYCDDVSGNVSKKWNKHNSFLFTAAGLPRAEVHKESSIHFLCTSNIATPLEMLDGVVDQLEAAQRDGIWAWDATLQERVLVIPSVLAFLGDNPMQSEIACHIGFNGNLFCRVCKVSGVGAGEDEDEEEAVNAAGYESDTSAASRGSKGGRKKGKKKADETMDDMIHRLDAFMKPSTPRTRADSESQLAAQFEKACTAGGKTAYGNMKTESGLKDTFMEQILEQRGIFAAGVRKGRSKPQKQRDIDQLVTELPRHPCTSPIWRIKDLDPHRDTPVEILHTILLGFVKYLWRDVLTRVKKPDLQILIHRLSSVNVSGLGVPPLSGHTLVTYGRSLTGRDFRVIAQVAPFVLHGLVDDAHLHIWVILSKIVTLVWRPEIDDLDKYLAELQVAIDDFLDHTCALTPQWFNKPKFHVLLHLPDHIRRFGPAMLFATEGFESFNAIIRSASVHSNRHAPSRDIATRMARGSRIRHLVSGGHYFVQPQNMAQDHVSSDAPWNRLALKADGSAEPVQMRVVGDCVKQLLSLDSFGSRMLGLDVQDMTASSERLHHTAGALSGTVPDVIPFSRTHHARLQVVPQGLSAEALSPSRQVRTALSIRLRDGSPCAETDWVVWDEVVEGYRYRRIGKVVEFLQIAGGLAGIDGCIDSVLVQRALRTDDHEAYQMPHLELVPEYIALMPAALLGVVNVQHNCVDNKCALERIGVQLQEREQAKERVLRVHHKLRPDDVILNIAQMRSAAIIDPFRRATPRYRTRAEIIFAAARKAADEKKSGARDNISTATVSLTGPSSSALSLPTIASASTPSGSTSTVPLVPALLQHTPPVRAFPPHIATNQRHLHAYSPSPLGPSPSSSSYTASHLNQRYTNLNASQLYSSHPYPPNPNTSQGG